MEQQKKQGIRRWIEGQGGGTSPDKEVLRAEEAYLATNDEHFEGHTQRDKKFNIEFDRLEILTETVAEGQREVSRTRSTYRTLATSFDEAEADLNRGLWNIRQLVSSTAISTAALFGGAGDRLCT